jgi:hypothetical protein
MSHHTRRAREDKKITPNPFASIEKSASRLDIYPVKFLIPPPHLNVRGCMKYRKNSNKELVKGKIFSRKIATKRPHSLCFKLGYRPAG